MAKFVDFIENMIGDTSEFLRDIRIIINNTLQQTARINGFGIDEINFDVISQEKENGGVQLNLETTGTATAKNKDHISSLLQKLMMNSRKHLWDKKIFLELFYHKLDVSETRLEGYDETPVGLRRKLHFRIIGAAIIFEQT